MNADGECLCRQIQFEAQIDPKTATICHCTDCQINSGTAFGYVVGAVNDSFKLLTGELSFYIKSADSGVKRELAFCGNCGTRIYARPVDGKSSFFGLRVGTIRQRRDLQPKRQVWKRSCLDWVELIETEQTFETQAG
ncbi:GFA family protein [Paracoccaceae bacterium]|nr:GFA family protein [Paracoccaceae bacterium]